MNCFNEWTVSGEVYYLKELEGEFSASAKIRGTASRQDGVYSSQILELPFLMQRKVYDEAKKKGLKVYRTATFSGHLETWHKTKNGKPCDKVMFVADYILEVA